jgi:pimeloyl-ACP methyl ester carboxylesterase
MARDRDVAAFGERAQRYDEGWLGQTISFSRSDRTFQPSACAQNRGQAGQIMSVNDDVVESDGHVDSMRDTGALGPTAGAPRSGPAPCDVVDREKRLDDHGCGGQPGEGHDVPVQVGLIGVTAVGGDRGRVLARHQAMDGMVEADQLRGALGRQADLRMDRDHRRLRLQPSSAARCSIRTMPREQALPERLATLSKPLLVIFGEDDRRWRSSSAAEYRAVPGATVEMLPGVGHSPNLEDPPRTAVPLLAFAASHTPQAD